MPFLENVTGGRGIPRERLERGRRSTTSSSAAARRSTTSTATWSRPSRPTWPRPASTCPSTGATATGTPTSPTRSQRMTRRRGDPGGLLRHQRLLVVVGLPAVPREPVRRRSAVAAVGERAGARQAAALLQPPRVRGAGGRRGARRADRAAATSVRDEAHLVFVTHSIPTLDERHQRPRRRRLRRPAPRRRGRGGGPGHRGDRDRPSPRPRLLLPVRAAARAVAGARRQRPPRGARRRTARRPSCSSRSGSSPTTWRSSTTSTPRRWPPPSGSACRPGARPPPGTDPRFVAMVRDLLLERAAAERGEDVVRASVGDDRPAVGPLPGRLLPEPARRPPRALRGGRVTLPSELADDLLELAVRTAREAGRLIQSGAARGVTVAATKSSDVDVVTEADRSAERLIRERLARRTPRRRGPGRGGRRRARAPPACAGSSTRSTAP